MSEITIYQINTDSETKTISNCECEPSGTTIYLRVNYTKLEVIEKQRKNN